MRKIWPSFPAAMVDIIRRALAGTLAQIRGLSSRLALPELDRMSLEEAVIRAVESYELRSGCPVSLHIAGELTDVPPAIKASAYRFLQQGLLSAFGPAGGAERRVVIGSDGVTLAMEFTEKPQAGALQDRAAMTVDACGHCPRDAGGLAAPDAERGMTRLSATFPLDAFDSGIIRDLRRKANRKAQV